MFPKVYVMDKNRIEKMRDTMSSMMPVNVSALAIGIE